MDQYFHDCEQEEIKSIYRFLH